MHVGVKENVRKGGNATFGGLVRLGLLALCELSLHDFGLAI